MTPEGVAALLVGAAALIGSLLGVWREVRQLHHLVNSRMTDLVNLTRAASLAEGRLAGERDEAPPMAPLDA